MKQKHWTLVLEDGQVQIDVRFRVAGGEVKDFSVNLSYLAPEDRVDVYRCDSAHGFIHAHKFWIADEHTERRPLVDMRLEEALT